MLGRWCAKRGRSRIGALSVRDDQARVRALGLIEKQPPAGGVGAIEWLNRLCCAVAQDLDVVAATITLGPPRDKSVVVAAHEPPGRRFAEPEFAVGEGPAHDAYDLRRPVLVPELGGASDGTWPGYATTAKAAGIRAVFAFPLQVGAIRVGVLTLHHDRIVHLAPSDLATCLVMAELATERLIDSPHAAAEEIEPSLDQAVSFRAEIYQAQGMVAVALGLTLSDSLATIRAHAFRTGRELNDVAYDIVHHGYRLAEDRDEHHPQPDRDEE